MQKFIHYQIMIINLNFENLKIIFIYYQNYQNQNHILILIYYIFFKVNFLLYLYINLNLYNIYAINQKINFYFLEHTQFLLYHLKLNYHFYHFIYFFLFHFIYFLFQYYTCFIKNCLILEFFFNIHLHKKFHLFI